jgi:hypothetical protein
VTNPAELAQRSPSLKWAGLIGSVRGCPVDLARNAKYMDDYGVFGVWCYRWIPISISTVATDVKPFLCPGWTRFSAEGDHRREASGYLVD